MSDKSYTLDNGQVSAMVIKPTFEGVGVPGKVTIDEAASDLKGLITLGAGTPDTGAGTVSFVMTAVAVGVQDATVVFKYADAGVEHADTENWGKSTKTVSLTINVVEAAALSEVSTPLTMNLWATQNLTFKVMKGAEDITSSVTGVTVTPESIAGKFEFSSEGGTYTFKSIQSATDAVVTATAVVTVAGTHGGTPFSLETNVVLNTNINDGEIPTNRFDVQFQ